MVHGDVKGVSNRLETLGHIILILLCLFLKTNIMIDEEGNARLTDFGISRMLDARGTTTKTIGGTVRWMARELVLPDDDDDTAAVPVTYESDVWSFGMTVLEVLFSLTVPFEFSCLISVDSYR